MKRWAFVFLGALVVGVVGYRVTHHVQVKVPKGFVAPDVTVSILPTKDFEPPAVDQREYVKPRVAVRASPKTSIKAPRTGDRQPVVDDSYSDEMERAAAILARPDDDPNVHWRRDDPQTGTHRRHRRRKQAPQPSDDFDNPTQ